HGERGRDQGQGHGPRASTQESQRADRSLLGSRAGGAAGGSGSRHPGGVGGWVFSWAALGPCLLVCLSPGFFLPCKGLSFARSSRASRLGGHPLGGGACESRGLTALGGPAVRGEQRTGHRPGAALAMRCDTGSSRRVCRVPDCRRGGSLADPCGWMASPRSQRRAGVPPGAPRPPRLTLQHLPAVVGLVVWVREGVIFYFVGLACARAIFSTI